jgi:hypothetical protein
MLVNKELLLDHEKQIGAIRNLTRSMGDTRKEQGPAQNHSRRTGKNNYLCQVHGHLGAYL